MSLSKKQMKISFMEQSCTIKNMWSLGQAFHPKGLHASVDRSTKYPFFTSSLSFTMYVQSKGIEGWKCWFCPWWLIMGLTPPWETAMGIGRNINLTFPEAIFCLWNGTFCCCKYCECWARAIIKACMFHGLHYYPCLHQNLHITEAAEAW